MSGRSDLIIQHLSAQAKRSADHKAQAMKQQMGRGAPPKAKAGNIAVRGHIRRSPRSG